MRSILRLLSTSFNPLHCGAVVASSRALCWSRLSSVSIPFIAGQWSLPRSRIGGASIRESVRFNPLHCGAVVASRSWRRSNPMPRRWCFNPLHCGAVVASKGAGRDLRRGDRGFNPLHCGAVVASTRRRRGGECFVTVSIPFIAGQWSLRAQRKEKR